MAQLVALLVVGGVLVGLVVLLQRASPTTGYRTEAARTLAAAHGLVAHVDEHEFDALRVFAGVRPDERPPLEVDYRFDDPDRGGSVFRQWTHHASFDEAGIANVESTHATRSHVSAALVSLGAPSGSVSVALKGSRRIADDAPIEFTGDGARDRFGAARDRLLGAEASGYRDLIVVVEGDRMYVRVRLLPLDRCPAFLEWARALAAEVSAGSSAD